MSESVNEGSLAAKAPRVLYDGLYDIATIEGPYGFTQLRISEREAVAVAQVLGLPFIECQPGTTIPA